MEWMDGLHRWADSSAALHAQARCSESGRAIAIWYRQETLSEAMQPNHKLGGGDAQAQTLDARKHNKSRNGNQNQTKAGTRAARLDWKERSDMTGGEATK